MMSFFSEPTPEPTVPEATPTETPSWIQPSKDQIPVAVPVSRRLAHVPGVALSLRRLDVYREGVAIKLQLDIRREPNLTKERSEALDELLSPRNHRPDRAQQLRLGVTLSNGTTVTLDNNRWTGSSADVPPEGPRLSIVGGRGGGSRDRWTSGITAWLWPFPPEDTLVLHYVSTAVGISEDSIELDLKALRNSSPSPVDLWAAPE